MTSITDINTALADLKADQATKLDALEAAITALQATVAGGGTADAADFDAALATIAAMKANVDAAPVPDTTTPPTA